MCWPNQRGHLRPTMRCPEGVDKENNTAFDGKSHFPAGSKTSSPGAAKESQVKALGGELWKPFEPLDPLYLWFAGVCGDLKGNGQHLRPSKDLQHKVPNFYNEGQVVAAYQQGDEISIKITITTHHNGFMEFHVCDVDKCGGEISEDCFRDGHCYQLERASNPTCDSGESSRCGPKDPAYPGRWYLPCATVPNRRDLFESVGGDEDTILYKLPKDLECDHCVLQWYWASANTCNPPGVVDYFNDPTTKPDWGSCKGQNGAVGGYSRRAKECGISDKPQHYPEQFLQCADISIGKKIDLSPTKTPTPSPNKSIVPSPTPTPSPNKSFVPSPTPTASPSAEFQSSPSPSPAASVSETPKPSPSPSPTEKENDDDQKNDFPPYDADKVMKQGSGEVRDIIFVGDGQRLVSLHSMKVVNISPYDSISVEALVKPGRGISRVSFFWENDERNVIRGKAPFYMFGMRSNGPVPWDDVPLDEEIRIRVRAGDDNDATSVIFTRKGETAYE